MGDGRGINIVDITATLGGAPATDGTWYVYRSSFDASERSGKLFIDGVDTGAAVTGSGVGTLINDEDAPFLIGSAVGSAYFDGVIDAVVVAATYTATANEPLNQEPCCDYLSNMRGLWNFNGSSYADVINGNTLTPVNNPVFTDGYPFDSLCPSPTPTP